MSRAYAIIGFGFLIILIGTLLLMHREGEPELDTVSPSGVYDRKN